MEILRLNKSFSIRLTLLVLLSLICLNAQANLLSERTYKRLTDIHELMGEGKYDQALSQLNKLYPSVKSNPGDAAMVLQTYAYVYASKEDYRKAIDYFRQALALDALPDSGVQSVRYNLAQVCMADSDFRCAVKELEIWFTKAEKPKSQAYAMLGTAYAQLKNYNKAIPALRTAISKAEKPSESLYQLLLAIYYEKKDYRSSAALLEKMVVLFPNKKDYWMQLSGVYFNLKNDRKSLAVMELAYKRGLLQSERELINLANMFSYQSLPYKGARVLEKGLAEGLITPNSKHWERLGNTWMQAKEFKPALVALNKAAELADDGELYINIAMIHGEREDWAALAKAIEKAEKKGIKKKPGQALILKGTAYYQMKKYSQAKAAFNKALAYEKVKTQAQQWLAHLAQQDAVASEN